MSIDPLDLKELKRVKSKLIHSFQFKVNFHSKHNPRWYNLQVTIIKI